MMMNINPTSFLKAATQLSNPFPKRLRNSIRFRFLSNINAIGKILNKVHHGVFYNSRQVTFFFKT